MKDENLSEREVYYKYGSCIFEAKDAQSSIRSRIISAKKELGIIDDVVSIEYIPRTGKHQGILYEQGDKCRLFAWLADISETIDGVLYKKSLQGTYGNYTSKINNLTKEGAIEFSNGKKPVALIKQIISLFPDKEIKTYARISNVIRGYNKPVGIPANVKYFKCDWTPRKPEDYLLSTLLNYQ